MTELYKNLEFHKPTDEDEHILERLSMLVFGGEYRVARICNPNTFQPKFVVESKCGKFIAIFKPKYDTDGSEDYGQ